MREVLVKIMGWVGLILIQVLVLNNIHLFNVATPFIYIYLILRMPTGMSKNSLMLWAFLLGVIVDAFADTPGINAAATVLLAFLRQPLLALFTPRDLLENSIVPSVHVLGFSVYTKFVLFAVLVHHTALFILEYFSFGDVLMLLYRIVMCVLISTCCILAIDSVRK